MGLSIYPNTIVIHYKYGENELNLQLMWMNVWTTMAGVMTRVLIRLGHMNANALFLDSN